VGCASRKASAFSEIIPSPEKQARKRGKKQGPTHLTSDSNFKATAAKRKLKLEKLKPKLSKKAKAVRVALLSSDEDDPVPISDAENEENLPCGFCGVKYCEEKSVLKGEWIRCQRCKTWFHEVCVGAQGKKQFICGKCM
jgi:hypothetical protein